MLIKCLIDLTKGPLANNVLQPILYAVNLDDLMHNSIKLCFNVDVEITILAGMINSD
jgi:hypothetical protein